MWSKEVVCSGDGLVVQAVGRGGSLEGKLDRFPIAKDRDRDRQRN